MGLLDGGISALFGTVFGGLYLDGQIIAVSYTDDGTGSLTPVVAASIPCKVQVDACTERQKLEEGYRATDARLLILQSGIATKPVGGNRVVAKGVTYIIGPTVNQDPAASYWECRGSPLK